MHFARHNQTVRPEVPASSLVDDLLDLGVAALRQQAAEIAALTPRALQSNRAAAEASELVSEGRRHVNTRPQRHE